VNEINVYVSQRSGFGRDHALNEPAVEYELQQRTRLPSLIRLVAVELRLFPLAPNLLHIKLLAIADKFRATPSL
jgi:hypothetical protein